MTGSLKDSFQTAQINHSQSALVFTAFVSLPHLNLSKTKPTTTTKNLFLVI